MSRNQFLIYSSCLIALILLNGCAKTREAFGLNRHQPDEFTTPLRAPLDRPENSDLVVPQQGAQYRGHVKTDKKAQEIIVGPVQSNTSCETISAVESHLLKETKADQSTPDIREKIDQDVLRAQRSESLIRKVFFWQKQKEAGDIIDPVKEYTKLHDQAVKTE